MSADDLAPNDSANTSTHPPAGYRQCAGIFLLNRRGEIFVARRNDLASDSSGATPWQMPQGGIDPGETPAAAAIRELLEEIGTDRAAIIGESAHWYSYDFPPEVAHARWNGKYRGQTQKWFAMRFEGTDADIDLDTAHPEFDAWQWVGLDRLIDLAVPFKRQVYGCVVAEFASLARDIARLAST